MLTTEDAINSARKELTAVKLLVQALIVQDALRGAPNSEGRAQVVTQIRDMALGAVNNSKFSDPETADEWISAIKSEINNICNPISFS